MILFLKFQVLGAQDFQLSIAYLILFATLPSSSGKKEPGWGELWQLQPKPQILCLQQLFLDPIQ